MTLDSVKESQKFAQEELARRQLINKYVSVVVEGQLDVWTGPNPDKDPTAFEQARKRARIVRSQTGKTAYAVVVKEIPDAPATD
jgi:hypothetical protein